LSCARAIGTLAENDVAGAPLLDLGTRAENRPWAPHRADPDPAPWKRARTTRARVA
jgi:hypothetical protein